MRYAMSRGRRNVLAVIIAAAAVLLVAVDRTAIRPALRYQRTLTQSQQNAGDFEKYHSKAFAVVKAVDGDTIDIDIPDGKYNDTRIRLWGVDTPETKDPRTGPMYFGKEASDFTTKLALGKRVAIFLDANNGTRRKDPNTRDKDPNAKDKDLNAKAEDPNTRDKYHRLLAYVQLPDGNFLNEELLSEGYAYADLRFKHGLYNKYKQLESAARKEKKGLWAGVTFEQMPPWVQRERPELKKK
jgi:micrococcal nuclease